MTDAASRQVSCGAEPSVDSFVTRTDVASRQATTEGARTVEMPGPCRRRTKPRRTLFTPRRVEGAPPAKALTPTRVTIGRFVDSGEEFSRLDSWRSRRDAHLDLGRAWIGETRFFAKSESGSFLLLRLCFA